MADFLLELFSEEIPARMQAAAATQLAERFTALLADAGLQADNVETFVTPRRLALLAKGLPAASAATSEERRGPRADAPEQAVAGFLKSTGLSRDQLEERDTDKGRFLFAVLASEGRPTADLLAAKLPAMIEGFQWPKSMRWLPTPFRWVRPLRGIVALLDSHVIPFEVQGVASGQLTHGHRFMGDDLPLQIDSAHNWAAQLQGAFVLVDADERRSIIRQRAGKAAEAAGLLLVEDTGLEAENAGLTEWPVPLLGRFDPAFLDVPPEIIQLTMKVNQKYFAVANPDGTLAPAFVCVANLEAPDGGEQIIAGNERVLSARLSDARFFWEQDKKQSLEQHAEGLKTILFHEKLGTMAEKVERVAKLARWLVETYPDQFPGATPDTVDRAARLAKADLTTGTVGEFPELQGIIGGYLAEVQGEKPGVVSALKQHYSPVPEGCVPVAVALADRLDTLWGHFRVGEVPTGSKDPFALRRAAISIIRMMLDARLQIGFQHLSEKIIAFYRPQAWEFAVKSEPAFSVLGVPQKFSGFNLPTTSDDGVASTYLEIEGIRYGPIEHGISRRIIKLLSTWHIDRPHFEAELFSFFADRLKVQQREAGVRPDTFDAVFALGNEDDIVRLLARVQAVQAFLDTDDGANLLAGYRRAANILRAEEKKDGQEYRLDLGAVESDYIGETEKNLARLFARTEGSTGILLFDEADALFGREDFAGVMTLLAKLRDPVDAFFEHVTVNDPDPAVRERRLKLLAGVRQAMHKVADFSRIQGQNA